MDYTKQTREQLVAIAEGYGLTVPAHLKKAEVYHLVEQYLRDRAAAVADEDAEVLLGNVPDDGYESTGMMASIHAIRPEGSAAVDDALARWKEPDPGVDVDVIDHARATAARTLLPGPAEFTQMERMAAALFRANSIRARRLNTEADVLVVLLAARDLGISPTMGFQKIHSIDGHPTLSAELMVALVRKAGYSILPKVLTNETAVAAGKRGDETAEFEFTIEDARRAKLAGKDNYEHYPKAMLWARAVSGLSRILFPDVLAGLTYTPEDFGYDSLDVEGWEAAPTAEPEPAPELVAEADVQNLRNRTAALDEADALELSKAWKDARLGSIHEGARRPLTVAELPKVEELLARYEIDDAEIIPEGTPEQPLPPCETAGEETAPGPVAQAEAFLGKHLPTHTAARSNVPDPTVEREPDVDGVPDRGGPASVNASDPIDHKAARRGKAEADAALARAKEKFEAGQTAGITDGAPCPTCLKSTLEPNDACPTKSHPF